MDNKSRKEFFITLTLKDIAVTGLMVAIIEVAKAVLSFLPNVELTSFLLILYTLTFGIKAVYTVPVFILLEGMVYGMNLWWIMYLYAWPLLVLMTLLLKKNQSVWFWSIFSAIFGLSFGVLCALPYFFIGWVNGSFLNGVTAAITWWIAGIPWDIVHCIGNFILMLMLYHPVRTVLTRCRNILYPASHGTK